MLVIEILGGLRQLERGAHGRITTVPSVATIRKRTGLSQPKFARLLGVSVQTLQEWDTCLEDEGAYADIVALVLESNSFPTGSSELTANADSLRQIRIEGKK